MSDLWTEASIDVEAENHQRLLTGAMTAVASLWPTLAGAESEGDLSNRLALVAARIDSIVDRVVGSDPNYFPVIRAQVEANLTNDWRLHHEAQREAATRARVEAEISRRREASLRERVIAENTRRAAARVDATPKQAALWDVIIRETEEGFGAIPFWESEDAVGLRIEGQWGRTPDGNLISPPFEATEEQVHQLTEFEGFVQLRRLSSRKQAANPEWLTERVNDPYGTSPNAEFWSGVEAEDVNGYRVFEKDGKWYAYHLRQNYWMALSATDKAGAHAEVSGLDSNLDMHATRKRAVDLTNVGKTDDPLVFKGKDSSGNEVRFRVTQKEADDLKAVLYSDLAINFSGVSVDESDIVTEGSRKQAEDSQTCEVCGDKIARDPESEEPQTWHHDNGEKHDHEAKPADSSKESAHKEAGNPWPVGTPAWFDWEAGEGDPASYGPYSGVPSDLFPEGGVPLRGDLTPEQEAWLKGRKGSRKIRVLREAGFPLCAAGCGVTVTAHVPLRNTDDGLAHVTCPSKQATKLAWIEEARRVVTSHQAETVEGSTLDAQTAQLLVQVHDALSADNQAKFASLPLTRAVDIAWRVTDRAASKGGGNPFVGEAERKQATAPTLQWRQGQDEWFAEIEGDAEAYVWESEEGEGWKWEVIHYDSFTPKDRTQGTAPSKDEAIAAAEAAYVALAGSVQPSLFGARKQAIPQDFWEAIEAQLRELQSARTADDVMRILDTGRNPYGSDVPVGAPAFFAGGGGDVLPDIPLSQAGWRTVWQEAPYYFVMEAPDGSRITYIEGDVYKGDRRATASRRQAQQPNPYAPTRQNPYTPAGNEYVPEPPPPPGTPDDALDGPPSPVAPPAMTPPATQPTTTKPRTTPGGGTPDGSSNDQPRGVQQGVARRQAQAPLGPVHEVVDACEWCGTSDGSVYRAAPGDDAVCAACRARALGGT